MKGRPATLCLLISLLLVAAGVLVPDRSQAAGLTPQEERGRQIYDTGRSPAGRPITAYFGKDLLEVPGESATCTSCHGHDGLGRTESGVIPSNITWRHLMKSYGHVHPSGVEHGAFTEQSLASYLRDGVYPGGRQGDPSMPVYDIADEDLAAVIAYNKRLGILLDPGLNATTIRIGTMLPAGGAGSELGEVLRATIQGYFAEVNRQGGIYGRTLELVTARLGAGEAAATGLQKLLARDEPFALVGTFTPGRDRDLALATEAEKVPLVAPHLPLPLDSAELLRYRFLLFAGLPEQVQVLARAATGLDLAAPRIALLYPQRPGSEEAVGAAEAVFLEKGWARLDRLFYHPGAFDAARVGSQLRAGRYDLLFFLGDEAEAEALLPTIAALDPLPHLFVPAVLFGRGVYQLPASFKDRAWLAFATFPSDRKEWGLKEFAGVMERQGVAVTQLAAQLTAYAGAKLLVEGLRRAGRDLSREGFLETMERFFEYDTGLTPPVSYGRNRRVGALGAHVVTVDPTKTGTSEHVLPRGWTPLK